MQTFEQFMSGSTSNLNENVDFDRSMGELNQGRNGKKLIDANGNEIDDVYVVSSSRGHIFYIYKDNDSVQINYESAIRSKDKWPSFSINNKDAKTLAKLLSSL